MGHSEKGRVKNMHRIDLNCDFGESFGRYQLADNEELLEYVTSVNIACGFHAGDPSHMHRMVQLASAKGCAIGAHPGLPDLVGFGRRNMDITANDAYTMVVYQIGALQAFCTAQRVALKHVKPHGALYNMAAENSALADAIAKAVWAVDPGLILYALSGSELIKAGKATGLRTASEVFADRTYQQDGSLTSRSQPDALIAHDDVAVAQVIRFVKEGAVRSQQGHDVLIEADTVCIHGDGAHALDFARKICTSLKEREISVQPLDK